jgi:F-box and WD-40 domain protein CDC4
MDPPVRPKDKRRAALLPQINTPSITPRYVPEGSPSPFTSNPNSINSAIQNRRPRSSQTVSIGWAEGQDKVSQRTSRLQIELAECVETKTVTTTTTTKRSYPPLLVRQRSLASLDQKEYPLAAKDTPPELANFSFELDGQIVDFDDEQQELVFAISLFWSLLN